MSEIIQRIVIFTRDVMNITGYKERKARYILQEVRDFHKKSPKDLITVHEFASYMKMTVAEVQECLKS